MATHARSERLKYSRHKSVGEQWYTTAAIGGKKANKLISLLEQAFVGLFRIFPDETQTRQYFQCRRWQANHHDFSPIVVIPMVLPFRTKPLYRSILIKMASLPFLNLMAVSVSSKETVAVLYEPSGVTPNGIMCSQTKTSFFIVILFTDDIVYSFKSSSSYTQS